MVAAKKVAISVVVLKPGILLPQQAANPLAKSAEAAQVLTADRTTPAWVIKLKPLTRKGQGFLLYFQSDMLIGHSKSP